MEVLKIAASNVPHAEVLEKAEPILEEQGIDLEIEVFQDYILPNQVLADGDVDANYFQHIPYFESIIEEKGYEFENAGGIHIEPIGVYSKRCTSLDELPEGATIMLSSQVQDHGRILTLLQSEGLITLDAGLVPTKDAIAIEDSSSPYLNIIA